MLEENKNKRPHQCLKVSIITVCYNSKTTIEKTFQSVLSQEYENIEYIVIDGGSTDGTQDIIERYSSCIDHYLCEPDKGIYDAMNKGIALATGDIIGFLNSDDVFSTENSLQLLVAPFSDKTVEAVYADLVYVNAKNKIVRYWQSGPFEHGSFSKGWSPPHPTFYVRRDIYRRCGDFNTDYPMGNDIELMIRFLEKYQIKAFYVPKIVVRMKTGGVSNKTLSAILAQNKNTANVIRYYKLDFSIWRYIFGKAINRFWQFFSRPTWSQF